MLRTSVFILFLLVSKFSLAQLTYQKLYVDYDSIYQYHNLAIIPIRPKGPGRMPTPEPVSFGRAVREGWAEVTERGTTAIENVHWIRINNNSDKPLLIASGEIVTGGRQDRMITGDTVLVPNGRDQYVRVMCVEEERWSEKAKKFSYSGYANPRLRKVLDQTHSQVQVWKEIYNQLDSSHTKAPTLAYTTFRDEKKTIHEHEAYLDFFKEKLGLKDSSVVGMICISGNRILGCDVFAGRNLFADQLESLLPGYIDEAMTFGDTPRVPYDRVKKYADKLLSDEDSQADYVKKNGRIVRYQGQVIHLTGYSE